MMSSYTWQYFTWAFFSHKLYRDFRSGSLCIGWVYILCSKLSIFCLKRQKDLSFYKYYLLQYLLFSVKGNVENQMHLSWEGMLHYHHFLGLISAFHLRVVSVHRLLAWKGAGYWAPLWTLHFFFCLLHYMFLSVMCHDQSQFKTCEQSKFQNMCK